MLTTGREIYIKHYGIDDSEMQAKKEQERIEREKFENRSKLLKLELSETAERMLAEGELEREVTLCGEVYPEIHPWLEESGFRLDVKELETSTYILKVDIEKVAKEFAQ